MSLGDDARHLERHALIAHLLLSAVVSGVLLIVDTSRTDE